MKSIQSDEKEHVRQIFVTVTHTITSLYPIIRQSLWLAIWNLLLEQLRHIPHGHGLQKSCQVFLRRLRADLDLIVNEFKQIGLIRFLIMNASVISAIYSSHLAVIPGAYISLLCCVSTAYCLLGFFTSLLLFYFQLPITFGVYCIFCLWCIAIWWRIEMGRSCRYHNRQLPVIRDHSFPGNVQFWAKPRNLLVSAEFLHCRGISHCTGNKYRIFWSGLGGHRHDCTMKYTTATQALMTRNNC